MPDCPLKGKDCAFQCQKFLYRDVDKPCRISPEEQYKQECQKYRKKLSEKKLFEGYKCNCGVMVLDLCRHYGCPPEELIYAVRNDDTAIEQNPNARSSNFPTLPLLEKCSMDEDASGIKHPCEHHREILCQCKERYDFYKKKCLKDLSDQYNEIVCPLNREQEMSTANAQAKNDKCKCQEQNLNAINRKYPSYSPKNKSKNIKVVKQISETPEIIKVPSPCLIARMKKEERRLSQLRDAEAFKTLQSDTSPMFNARSSRQGPRNSRTLPNTRNSRDSQDQNKMEASLGRRLSSTKDGTQEISENKYTAKRESRASQTRSNIELNPAVENTRRSRQSGYTSESTVATHTESRSNFKLGSRTDSNIKSSASGKSVSQHDSRSLARLSSGEAIIYDSHSVHDPNKQHIFKSGTFQIIPSHTNNTKITRGIGKSVNSSAIQSTRRKGSDAANKMGTERLNNFGSKNNKGRKSNSTVNTETRNTYGSSNQKSNPNTAASMRYLSKLLRPEIRKSSSPESTKAAESLNNYEPKKTLRTTSQRFEEKNTLKSSAGHLSECSGRESKARSSPASVRNAGSSNVYSDKITRSCGIRASNGSNSSRASWSEVCSSDYNKYSDRCPCPSYSKTSNRNSNDQHKAIKRLSSPESSVGTSSVYTSKTQRRITADDSVSVESPTSSRLVQRPTNLHQKPITETISDESSVAQSSRQNSSTRNASKLENKRDYKPISERVDNLVEERFERAVSESEIARPNKPSILKLQRSQSPELTRAENSHVSEKVDNEVIERFDTPIRNTQQDARIPRSNTFIRGNLNNAPINFFSLQNTGLGSPVRKALSGSPVTERSTYVYGKMDNFLDKRTLNQRRQHSSPGLSRLRYGEGRRVYTTDNRLRKSTNDSMWQDNIRKSVKRDLPTNIGNKARNSFLVYTKRKSQKNEKNLAKQLDGNDLFVTKGQESELTLRENRSIDQINSLVLMPRRQSRTLNQNDEPSNHMERTSKVRIATLPPKHTDKNTIEASTQTVFENLNN